MAEHSAPEYEQVWTPIVDVDGDIATATHTPTGSLEGIEFSGMRDRGCLRSPIGGSDVTLLEFIWVLQLVHSKFLVVVPTIVILTASHQHCFRVRGNRFCCSLLGSRL